jgi:hypothetical protein
MMSLSLSFIQLPTALLILMLKRSQLNIILALQSLSEYFMLSAIQTKLHLFYLSKTEPKGLHFSFMINHTKIIH